MQAQPSNIETVLGHTYEGQNCSAARTLEVVGERWSLLILRDALFRGFTRFSEFERSLGVAPNILAKRLDAFIEAGLFTPGTDGHGAEHKHYRPTEKCFDLKPIIMSLTVWGDKWFAPDGPPVQFLHKTCGSSVTAQVRCAQCELSLALADIVGVPVPSVHRVGRNSKKTKRPRRS